MMLWATQSIASDTTIKSLERFLVPPAKNFEINYRVTSKVVNAMPVVAHVNVRGVDKGKYREYFFKIDYPNGTRRYCMACGSGYFVNKCENSELDLPGLNRSFVKGTLLPWGELTDGLCMSWSVKELIQDAGLQKTIVEIRPKKQLPRIGWDYTRAYLDESGRPSNLERVSKEGKILRKIRILEIRKFFSMMGVRKALVEYGSTRVLLEAQSMQLLDDEEDSSF